MDIYSILKKYNQKQKEVATEERIYQVHLDRFREEERIISEYYDAQEAKLRAEFQEQLARINKERKTEIKSLIPPKFSDKLVIAREELSKIEKTLRTRFAISHQKMCELLKEETNLEWKVKEIGGYESGMMYGGHLVRYGIALINENHDMFANSGERICFAQTQSPTHTENAIICIAGSAYPRSHRNENQKQAENFDWFTVFLKSKNVGNNSEEIATRCGLYEEEILNAIEKYVKTIALGKNDFEEEIESE